MRILHTSDFHLRELGDQRWSAFEAIVTLGTTERVDLLVISGDLFDTPTAAEELRPHLRSAFSAGGFETIILPGNHDARSYQPGYFFGKGVTFFNDDNLSNNVYDTGKARFIGLPFRDLGVLDMARLFRELQPLLDQSRSNILIYHGELLDAFHSREDFGPEGAHKYMPAKLSHFQELDVDYVLAGHFHTHFREWKLGPNRFFIYPGSPVSITRKEIGQRRVNLLELGGPPSECLLDTFHYCDPHITFDATQGIDPIRQVTDCLNKIHPSGQILLTLDGHVTRDEAEIVGEVERLLESRPHDQPNYRFKDVSRLLEYPLFDLIGDRLTQERFDEDQRAELQDLFLRAMTEAGL